MAERREPELRQSRRANIAAGLLTPFGGQVLWRFGGGSLPNMSSPAASKLSERRVHQKDGMKQMLGFSDNKFSTMVLQ